MSNGKDEIVTFKVDKRLSEAMEGIPNRSQFIRSAIMAALDGKCPLCKGAGTLTLEQKKHWEIFAQNHSIRECEDCHAYHLVCEAEASDDNHF